MYLLHLKFEGEFKIGPGDLPVQTPVFTVPLGGHLSALGAALALELNQLDKTDIKPSDGVVELAAHAERKIGLGGFLSHLNVQVELDAQAEVWITYSDDGNSGLVYMPPPVAGIPVSEPVVEGSTLVDIVGAVVIDPSGEASSAPVEEPKPERPKRVRKPKPTPEPEAPKDATESEPSTASTDASATTEPKGDGAAE